MAQRETENNAYAKLWGDKERALWYVMVFSGVVNCNLLRSCFRLFTQCSYPRRPPFSWLRRPVTRQKLLRWRQSVAQLSMLTDFHRECKCSIVIPPGGLL